MAKPFLGIEEQVKQGIAVLRRGGVIAYPTDTVYGLGASLNRPEAVARIYEVKGRRRNLALPVLLADILQIADITNGIPPSTWCFIRNFWPGALTLVLRKSSLVPDIVTGNGDTVAIRIPDHPVPLELIRGLGSPLVGTSANLSGQPSSLTADEVRMQLGDKIDLVIDGGRCPGGRESTIIDVTVETPRMLRSGAITEEELRQACGDIKAEGIF
ncbi:MAG: threonylcarbamoyl-AMP synthase [Chloroflexi bacterium]|nr:threonylcarbamoyl-AMP synthase [Chloroflexota bacterium]